MRKKQASQVPVGIYWKQLELLNQARSKPKLDEDTIQALLGNDQGKPDQVTQRNFLEIHTSRVTDEWAARFERERPSLEGDKPHRSRPWGYKGPQVHREGYPG